MRVDLGVEYLGNRSIGISSIGSGVDLSRSVLRIGLSQDPTAFLKGLHRFSCQGYLCYLPLISLKPATHERVRTFIEYAILAFWTGRNM